MNLGPAAANAGMSRGSRQKQRAGSASGFGDIKLALPVKLFLTALMLPFVFYLGPLYMTGIRLVLLVLIVPLTVMLLAGRFGRLHIVDYAFIGHLAWMALAMVVNNPERMIQNIGAAGVEFLGGYLIGRACIRNRKQFISLCKALSILVMVMLPLAIYESQTGRPIVVDLINRMPFFFSWGDVRNEPRLGLERAQVVFAHPIHFGLFCSVAFSMTYVGLEGIYSQTRRLFVSAAIGLAGFLALSSGALLAMVLQLGLITWYAIFHRVKYCWWILLGLTVMAYVVVDILSNRSPVEVFLSRATFSSHTAYWRLIIFEWGMKNIFGDATLSIPASPIFGIGLNDWVRPYYMYSGSMDNFWLVMGVRYGVPGVGLLAIGYFATIIGTMRRNFLQDEELKKLRRAWVFTFVGLTFTLSTVHVWSSMYAFVFFMFGTGVWFLSVEPRREEDPTEEFERSATVARFDRPSKTYSRFRHRS